MCLTAIVKKVRVQLGARTKLTALQYHAAAIVMVTVAERYRQLHTKTKRRLLRARRVRFNLDGLRRSRFGSIAFVAPASVLSAPTCTLSKLSAISSIRQKFSNVTCIGQIFVKHWLNPVLKYVVSGRRLDARVFVEKQATGRKFSIFLRKRHVTVRRQLRKRRVAFFRQQKTKLRTRPSRQSGKFQKFTRPALQAYRRKRIYA